MKKNSKKPILLIAPNMRQAQFHAHAMGLDNSQWKLITTIEELRAYRNFEYKLVGEYYKLRDYGEIDYFLKYNKGVEL